MGKSFRSPRNVLEFYTNLPVYTLIKLCLFDIFQEKGVRYLIHDVHCDENGDFQQAQCAVMLNSGREGCFCIDRENWMSHVPGPMAHTREELDCSMINSGRGPYQGG